MVIFETIPHTETKEIGSTAAAPITTGTKVIKSIVATENTTDTKATHCTTSAQHTTNTKVSMINSISNNGSHRGMASPSES